MPVAEVNNQSLYYEVTGSGPAVLFSHGFLMDHSMWNAQVEELAKSYTCITWDERGFGKTEFARVPFDMWDSAADAIRLLDHLGIEEAVLVGMSQGGYLTMRAAVRFPSRVKAVALIDTNASGLSSEDFHGYRDFFAKWAADGPTEEQIRAMADTVLGRDDLVREWEPKWRELDPENMRWAFPASLPQESILPLLGTVKAPLLVIHGTEDVGFPVSMAEEIGDAAANCVGVHILEGATHAANMTHPAETNRLLLDFLAKHA